jgi:hypothetical protein
MMYFVVKYTSMFTPVVGPVEAMEAQGFAIVKSYIETDAAEGIHTRTFTPGLEPTRDARGELDVAYACWDDPDIDNIVDDVTQRFNEAGYPDWRANDITLRDTLRGFEEHQDDLWFRWGSAILYLHGITEMQLTNSLEPDQKSTETLTAGDLLLLRQAGDPPNHTGPQDLDRRTRHGANLDQVETFGDRRSFLYVAYVDKSAV